MSLQRLPRPNSRTIVVGDIHGCLAEFNTLLANLKFSSDDLLLSVGDFLDRGPDSWGVARFFRDTPNAFATTGNHERRVAGVIRGTSEPAWSQLHTLSQLPASEHAQWAGWLEALPAVIATPDVIVTHARLDPGQPLDQQDSYYTCAVGGFRVKIECDDDGVPLWYQETSYPKTVCMGHISYTRTELVPGRLYALDSGCCDSGQLSALVLPTCDVVAVQAPISYTRRSRSEWEWSQLQDLATRPLRHLIRLREQIAQWDESPQREDAEARISTLLNEVDFSLGLAEARPRLIARFGPIPPPSPERGEYFQLIARECPTNLARILTRASLCELPLGLSQLVSSLTDENIEDVIQAIAEL